MAVSGVENLAFRDTDPSHRFNPPQSTFSFNRRMRPPPMHFSSEVDGNGRVPLRPQKLGRRESKGGLRGMFTRAKNQTEKNIVSPVMEEPPPEKPQPAVPRSLSITRSTTVASSNTPTTPSRQPARTSRMNLRSKSVKPKRTPSKPSPKSSKSSPRAPTRTSAAWDPPPLFQAYPQAIKHATLSASTLSADAILRLSNHKRNNSLRDEIAQGGHDGDGNEQGLAAKKAEKKSKHRRQISGSISKADWTQKIFILVTSGYLLQYAGDGSFDRLPEKMMQLGKESVAFASDVIPGKHWVLQISQAMDADGSPAADSRSLLSRLAFRGADYRRTATSLLLVLNSAEDMDSWLAVVRREIEALGGKKHVSETGKPKADDKVMQLKAQPSHRYLVPRGQSSNPSSPQSPSLTARAWNGDIQLQQKLEATASDLAKAQSATARPSTGNRSAANSVASHDERQLENLRDSANRLSFMSSGQRTLITSQGSSPTTSPTRESCSTVDDFPPKNSFEDIRMRPNASAINERRRSMQNTSIQVLEAHQPANFRPHSTYGGPSRPVRNQSPTTPNFSVPNSSSKRYSTMKSPPMRRDMLNVPDIVTTAAEASYEPTSMGSEISMSNATVYQPLDPTKGSPNVPRLHIQPHVEAGWPVVEETEIRYVERSALDRPLPLAPINTSFHEGLPERRSSLMLQNAGDAAFLDFQFPRRYSSTQTLNDTTKNGPRPSLLPAPSFPSPLSESPSHYTMEDESDGTVTIIPSLPALANTKSKLRRPTSMQIHASQHGSGSNPQQNKSPRLPSVSSTNLHNTILEISPTLNSTKSEPKLPSSLVSPSIHHLRVDESLKTLANRKSMPLLVTGPPPAPPPDCALPPLPPPGGAMKSPPIGFRNSVQV
ncbi:hypothetical protein G7Y89_g3163 [Cudoniella acicularis]|uniref:PH domain-containing protein n=1 Tax=Cudoniella acicularis TaxID=354080 RepID=A0A8H4RT63_9HELO|nr:hypothetical protein G7Y89_g3163 [Cudoniella acicularis]